MIQFLLLLLGLTYPNSNRVTISNDQDTIIIQGIIELGENLDTGGETGPVLLPKK